MLAYCNLTGAPSQGMCGESGNETITCIDRYGRITASASISVMREKLHYSHTKLSEVRYSHQEIHVHVPHLYSKKAGGDKAGVNGLYTYARRQ